MIFRFIMFLERLEYDKYDFQHLQGAVRCVYGHKKKYGLLLFESIKSPKNPAPNPKISYHFPRPQLQRAGSRSSEGVGQKVWAFLVATTSVLSSAHVFSAFPARLPCEKQISPFFWISCPESWAIRHQFSGSPLKSADSSTDRFFERMATYTEPKSMVSDPFWAPLGA